jgi:NDP-sugar pyrophosphorylase family protein
MQIVIPMSGFGERFRAAGYTVPKPLIEVDGKPIIAHVVDLFPGETDFIFICNEDHLATPEYAMAEKLKACCPTGRIVGIPSHRLGPVGAVLQVAEFIKKDEPVIVNYCDFTCYWDWNDFVSFAKETKAAGIVPAYNGFHPHSLGSTYYAYLRHKGLWIEEIQEKKPFTDTPMDEFASSGTYYFSSGKLCLDLFEEVVRRDINVNGEYYVSMAYKPLIERGLPAAIYSLQHFMQWGTPQDLEEYKGWSRAFDRLARDDGNRASQRGAVLIPMAGMGKRFSDAGYQTPKPLVPVSGRPMVLQAIHDLPKAPVTEAVVRDGMPNRTQIVAEMARSIDGFSPLVIDGPTEGQAITCRLGIEKLDPEAMVTIGACDNGMLYETTRLEALLQQPPDMLVWVIRGHADGRRRPEQFGWVEEDADGKVTGVRVKKAPNDPRTAAMIVGTFTFRRAGDFLRVCDRLVARNARVNGEFYVDSLVEDALALGLTCGLFEIDSYLGWGTPEDLKTFEYWQSCFHKWNSHPYRLERDSRIPAAELAFLIQRFQPLRPDRPTPPTRE